MHSQSKRPVPVTFHIRLTLLVALMAVAGMAAAPAETQAKTILNIAAKEPDTLDPHSSILGQTQAIVRFMYRGPRALPSRTGR